MLLCSRGCQGQHAQNPAQQPALVEVPMAAHTEGSQRLLSPQTAAAACVGMAGKSLFSP